MSNSAASLPTSPSSKVVNRFKSKLFDRSVYGDECTASSGECACCRCNPSPMVVVSANGENLCASHLISMRNVKELSDGGLLERLEEETFLIYAQRTPQGLQTGILAALDVEDCKNNVVKKHELCIPEHEKPLTQRMKQYQSLYVDPVMIMYKDAPRIDEIVARITSSAEPVEVPSFSLSPPCSSSFSPSSSSSSAMRESESDAQHFLWEVHDKADILAIQEAFRGVDALYIADGHHRTAAACRALDSDAPSSSSSASQGFASSKYLAALLYADTQLNVLSFNRCVKSLGKNVSAEQFLRAAEDAFVVEQVSDAHAAEIEAAQQTDCPAGQCMLMYLRRQWYSLTRHDEGTERDTETQAAAVPDIDAQVLVDKLFNPVIKLQYPESEKNMIYVDGRKGRLEVQKLVDSGDASAGFIVRRVDTRTIMKLADHNHMLPPKATFFDPKPMPGLMTRLKR